ncbi:MAG: NAD(+) synthetase [Candidatus Diapherotrites archaeon]|uniref:NH(3)-dependent NAD(+) synthetase n=1 Tax=Candidatus Iainarchaeum sp. TaxID=3101447 RepID=A0A2D6LQ66_9ARCH|nr:NAD(+) synthetase [Candidatus Diapherotrites archaeon]|tara:strand:- start:13914 stop:14684 length:771 start_codon:yes stop_codon:yes gene_type:complete
MSESKMEENKTNENNLSEKLISKIKNYFEERSIKKAVLGLSGGIDSAVVLALLVNTLGKENVTAILMPNSKITKDSSTKDAENLAKKLGVEYFIVSIDSVLEVFEILPWKQNNTAKANLNARARAVVLYNYANSNNCIVAGTGNKSEFYLGYFTKYGDAAADFFPIGALLKKEVRLVAEQLNIGPEFLDKIPSAELWENQEDEKELGLSYSVIDELLPLILKNKEIPKGKEDAAAKLKKIIESTSHKREQPVIITF